MEILHLEKLLPMLCISCMANYANYISPFDYDVVFKLTKLNANADYCSHALLQITVNTIHQLVSMEKKEVVKHNEFD